jgi:hypothetical protein
MISMPFKGHFRAFLHAWLNRCLDRVRRALACRTASFDAMDPQTFGDASVNFF